MNGNKCRRYCTNINFLTRENRIQGLITLFFLLVKTCVKFGNLQIQQNYRL